MGENLTAARAKDYGMVNEVVENMKEGLEVVKKMAEKITPSGPEAVTTMKRVINACSGQRFGPRLFGYCIAKSTQSIAGEQSKQGTPSGFPGNAGSMLHAWRPMIACAPAQACAGE